MDTVMITINNTIQIFINKFDKVDYNVLLTQACLTRY